MPKIGDILTQDFSTLKDLSTLEGIRSDLSEALGSFFGALGVSTLHASSKTDAVLRAWSKLEEYERKTLSSAFCEDDLGNIAFALLKIAKSVELHVASVLQDAGVSDAYLTKRLKALLKRPDLDPETRELVEKKLTEDEAGAEIEHAPTTGRVSWH